MRSSRGQASLEYVAVLAAVAVVFGVAGTAVADAGQIGRTVTREVARALCLVSAGDCRRDREPCVTTADGHRRGSQVHVLFVRLGGDETVLFEERSDGTVAVTHAPRDLAGVEASLGFELGLSDGGTGFGVSAEVQAAALAQLGGGRTWIVPSRAAADTLLASLADHAKWRVRERRGSDAAEPDPVPPPDITYDEDEVTVTAGAQVGAAAGVDLASVGVSGAVTRRGGVRVDRRTGRRTVFLATSATAEATLSTVAGVLGASRSAGTGGEVYALELDARGRPLALTVMATGRYDGSDDLPAAVAPVAGRLAVPAGGGRTYEVTVALDLTVPANLTAARGFLAALDAEHPVLSRSPAASAALRRRLEEAGTVEARVLRASRQEREISFAVGAGAKLGGEVSSSSWRTQLLAAASRGLDGEWLVREDCVAT